MNRQQRKEAFVLISNGGLLDSLEKGWDTIKNQFSDFSMKKTIEDAFHDPKIEKKVEERISEQPQFQQSSTKKEKSLKEVLNNLFKEIKEVYKRKEEEEFVAAATPKPPPSLTNAKPAQTKKNLQGYRRATGKLPSNANEEAKKILKLPIGSSQSIKLNDGKWYLAVVEEHFDNHPRGGGAPYKHKGVSLFEPIDGRGEDRGQHIA